jgi:hypothetical protein
MLTLAPVAPAMSLLASMLMPLLPRATLFDVALDVVPVNR